MFSRTHFVTLVAAVCMVTQAHIEGRREENVARQASTTSIDVTAQCELPASLLDNSIYQDQPTGSQNLLTWMRAIPCDQAACCIPSSFSSDWAAYTSSMKSWWSASSSIFEKRTADIYSWYSSAAQLPACSSSVHPVSTYTPANPDDPLGLSCPSASGAVSVAPWASEQFATTPGSNEASTTSPSSTATGAATSRQGSMTSSLAVSTSPAAVASQSQGSTSIVQANRVYLSAFILFAAGFALTCSSK